jgi:long-subunit fatty acid transport protein
MIRNFTTVLFINFLLSVTIVSFGQTEKGNMLLGGGIDLGSTTYKRDNASDQKVFSFNFNPGVSYFVSDNLSVGLRVPFSYSKLNQDTFDDEKSSSISFGPMVRYYIPFNQLAIFPEVSYVAGAGKFEGRYFDPILGSVVSSTNKYNVSNFNIGLGLAYFLNNNVAIESVLSYNVVKTEYDSDSFSDTETLSVGFDIGFQIYFQTKK